MSAAADAAIRPVRLRSNIAALSILQAMNYAVPLATVPYLVRTLGAEHFGLLSFAQAIVVYFDLPTDYGSLLSATRAIAVHRSDPEALAAVFWRTAAARMALAVGCAAALGTMILALPAMRAEAALYAAAFLTVIGTSIFPVWFFQGLEQMKYVTAAHAAARLATIPALILAVHAPDHYVRAAAIQGGVPIVAGAAIAPILWRKLQRRFRRPRAGEIAAVLREGWSAFVANSAMTVNVTATVTVLGMVAGAAEVGYYSAADKAIRALSALLDPVTRALYPHLSRLEAHSPDAAVRLMRRSYVWIGAPTLIVSLGAFAAARPVGMALWGQGFARSVTVLRCLAPLPFLLAAINLAGVQTLLVLGKDSLVSRTVFGGVLVNVALTAALSARYGALGAAAALVSSATVIVAGLAYSARRTIRS